MAIQQDKNNILPEEIKNEINEINSGKIKLFRINQNSINSISYVREKNIFIDQNSSLSANVFFLKGIKNSYSTINLAGSSVQTFSNLISGSSSTTLSSLYEHIRSYVYRPLNWNTYINSSHGPYIVSNSTTGLPTLPSIPGALTGIRVIGINKKLFKDYIKPNTLRIKILPINKNFVQKGLKFSNETLNNSDSGQYASITGMAGLSGSLSSGISGKVVTGFTIGIRFKPSNSGPTNQTLFHRRIADFSLSAINYKNLTNSSVITDRYINLNPLSAVVDKTSVNQVFSFSQWNSISVSALTSLVFNITNKGGGQLKWSISANNQQSISWLSISSALTTGIIYGITNIQSTTASITAIVFKTITGLSQGTPYTSNLILYNSTTGEVCPNIPMIIPITITTQSQLPE